MASEPLKQLLFQAHQSKLVLPEFQREFVWKPGDVIKLLGSLLNAYPIGGLLFMENTGAYGYRPLDGVQSHGVEKDVILVLDGQQRLTSCYRALFGALDLEPQRQPGRYYFSYHEYVKRVQQGLPVEGSDVIELIDFRHPKEVARELHDTSKELAAGLFPLDIIFQSPRGADYTKWLSEYAFAKAKGNKDEYEKYTKVQSQFMKFIERITGYQVHFEQIKKDTSPDVICTVFETINTTGKRLTVFDLLVARCYPKDIKLRDMLQAAIAENRYIRLFDGDGESLCVTALPRVISLLAKGVCRRGDMLELEPSVIKANWEQAIAALEKCLRTLATRFGCLGLRFVPLVDMVPPLAVILASEKFKDTISHNTKLAKWYWRCVFAQYFVASTETKAARTVKEWIGHADHIGWLDDDGAEPEAVRDFSYRMSILDGLTRMDSAAYAGVMTMLIRGGARDFGAKREKLEELSEPRWAEIEDHHIFPRGLLTPNGVKGERVNTILNRTPILGSTNLAIKNDAPAVYLANKNIVGDKPADNELLQPHGIPDMVKSPFSVANFDAFKGARKKLLLDGISKLVEQQPLPDEEP